MRDYRDIPVVDKGVITIVVTTSRNPTIGGCYIEDLCRSMYRIHLHIERRVSAWTVPSHLRQSVKRSRVE